VVGMGYCASQARCEDRVCRLIRDGGGGEVWRGGCEWCVVSVVVVLGEVGDGLFGIGH
jgi:hypothetical protein